MLVEGVLKIRIKQVCRRKGASLFEILLILALLCLLTSMAYPKIGGNREYLQLESAARSLALDMRLAQSHAVTTNSATRLVFYRFSNLYYVELSSKREWVSIPEEINIAFINFPKIGGRETLSFNFLGTPNQGGHVGLQNENGDTLYVIITPVTGRVRIGKEAP
ncbi:MAG: hypothetical protein CVU88_01965 [Firmicutes bacterium HGW-Firmicutes-13]|nr:MAG: hypothetical protein CVU88_01965 [Firmicutes bacterium HGW-Firmicutes-13]